MKKSVQIATVIGLLILIGFFLTQIRNEPLRPQNMNELLNDINSGKTIMWIGPHPDDELLMSGTIAYSCGDKNNKCYVVCLGAIENIVEGANRTLRQEQVAWLNKTYLTDYIILGNVFSSMTQEDLPKLENQLISKINEIKPDIIITFSPEGYYGHRQHIMASKLITDATPKLSYKPKLFYVINMDGFFDTNYYEYRKYSPTDSINLDIFSNKLGKTVWDAKLEILQKFSSTVGLVNTAMRNMQNSNNINKKEYFMKVM